MLKSRPTGETVLGAAERRIRLVFDRFDRICLSFSAGKDSTVMLHLVAAEARRQGRRFTCLLIDWEAQFTLTMQHAQAMFDLYADCMDPLWVCLPFTTTNACSMHEPEWVCWAPEKRDLWVRQPPQIATTDAAAIPFYRDRMTFEEFIAEFGEWFGQGHRSVSLVGIRTAESLNRWRSIANAKKDRFDNLPWTTRVQGDHWNAYPIYDWKVADIWHYHAVTGLPYNPLYDRFHAAGLTPHQMRICEPYGDEQRRGLWLYHVIEPETWARIVARVAGANMGAIYTKTSLLGDAKHVLPAGHTWNSYANFLLDTMPPPTADHYRNKIAVYLKWYRDHDTPELPDERDNDTGAKDVGSWRRICRMLLKNDYWAKTLCFSPTKTDAYDKYQKLMARRREAWGIYGGSSAE